MKTRGGTAVDTHVGHSNWTPLGAQERPAPPAVRQTRKSSKGRWHLAWVLNNGTVFGTAVGEIFVLQMQRQKRDQFLEIRVLWSVRQQDGWDGVLWGTGQGYISPELGGESWLEFSDPGEHRVLSSENLHTHHTWENPDLWLGCPPLLAWASSSSVWHSKECSLEQNPQIDVSIQNEWGSTSLRNKELHDTHLQEFNV